MRKPARLKRPSQSRINSRRRKKRGKSLVKRSGIWKLLFGHLKSPLARCVAMWLIFFAVATSVTFACFETDRTLSLEVGTTFHLLVLFLIRAFIYSDRKPG